MHSWCRVGVWRSANETGSDAASFQRLGLERMDPDSGALELRISEGWH